MKNAECCETFRKYKDAQIEITSAEDLLLVTACELIRLKDEKGVDLFWDNGEEKFMRNYIKSAGSFSQN